MSARVVTVSVDEYLVILHLQVKASHYFWHRESIFLGKNTSDMVNFENFERIYFGHFLTKMHIFAINRHLEMVES